MIHHFHPISMILTEVRLRPLKYCTRDPYRFPAVIHAAFRLQGSAQSSKLYPSFDARALSSHLHMTAGKTQQQDEEEPEEAITTFSPRLA